MRLNLLFWILIMVYDFKRLNKSWKTTFSFYFFLFQEDEDDLDSEEDEEEQQRNNEKSTSPTDWQKAGKDNAFASS